MTRATPPAHSTNAEAHLRSPLAKDHRGVDLISHALSFGRLSYDKPDDAIGYAKRRSRSQYAVIRVHDERGNALEAYSGWL
jgi:hypothetical protein